MVKKVCIKEQDIEALPEESRDEIVEQVNAQAPSPPEPPPPPPATAAPTEPAQQKADCKMRMRELYKCDACGKYLTKKSLNYAHAKTCKGRAENQTKAPKYEEPPQPNEQPYHPPPPYEAPPLPAVPLYDQLRMERRRQHLARINHLSQFIA